MRWIVWWTFERNICPVFALPLHDLVTIEKELVRSAKKPMLLEKATHCHGFLNQPTSSDISGIQNVQSYSPEYKITQKYLVRSMDEFLDSTHNPPTWKRSILKSRVPINNQHQVIFLTYRINNLTVQSVIYHFPKVQGDEDGWISGTTYVTN